MRKYLVVFMLFLTISLFGSHYGNWDFLTTAEDVNASATATNGSEFTSSEITLGGSNQGAITITFTRAAGSASTLDFHWQISYDGGATWASWEDSEFKIPTNETVITGTTVRITKEFNFYGISHIRLWKIVNNDSSNNVTACNATLSL